MSEKSEFYAKIYPHIWDQYVFLSNEKRRHDTNFSLLSAYIGILLVIYFQLFGKELLIFKIYYYVPLILFSVPLLLFIYQAIPRRIYIPSFTKEYIKEIFLSKRDFNEQVIRTIYGVIPHLQAYGKSKARLFIVSVKFTIIGIFAMVFAFLVDKAESYIPYLIILLIFVLWFVGDIENKEYVKENPSKEVDPFFDSFEINNIK